MKQWVYRGYTAGIQGGIQQGIQVWGIQGYTGKPGTPTILNHGYTRGIQHKGYTGGIQPVYLRNMTRGFGGYTGYTGTPLQTTRLGTVCVQGAGGDRPPPLKAKGLPLWSTFGAAPQGAMSTCWKPLHL